MSDAVASSPASQRAAERRVASDGNASGVYASDAKANAAPLKAFESALLNVKAATQAAATATPVAPITVAAAAAPNLARTSERNAPGATARDGGGKATAKADDTGPRPAASSTTTAIASGVQGGVATETTAKTAAQKSKGQPTSTNAKPATPPGEVANATAVERATGDATSVTAAAPLAPLAADTPGDALSPTADLSRAISGGSAAAVKAALQSTLQGFADGSVSNAIKASLATSGAPASAEVTGLLDSISSLAQEILDKGPLVDLDVANLDELFWVSNWFDLFTPSTIHNPINNSVSSAMALPIDVFYTRALLVPLVDAERVAAPGIVNRRAVRANTEPTPGR